MSFFNLILDTSDWLVLQKYSTYLVFKDGKFTVIIYLILFRLSLDHSVYSIFKKCKLLGVTIFLGR